ncbi:MAG: substrate-binding domain-containing protein [Syntrophotaleaceae bacterium]
MASNRIKTWFLAFLVALGLLSLPKGTALAAKKGEAALGHSFNTVRACVIGGMTMTGVWDEIVKRFETKHPYRVELVATGPLERITPVFRRGWADFLLMHSCDDNIGLAADGYAINLRPCARNDLVLLGPPSDPAGVRGLKDGAEALRRIAESKSSFIDVTTSNGSQELGHTLWQRAGIRPRGDWFLKDEAVNSEALLSTAEKKGAYFIFGRVPFTQAKHPRGKLEILVDLDPTMRRPYLLMEANPDRYPDANQAGAKALGDFILSEEVQTFLAEYGKDQNGGFPFFHPVWPYGPALH